MKIDVRRGRHKWKRRGIGKEGIGKNGLSKFFLKGAKMTCQEGCGIWIQSVVCKVTYRLSLPLLGKNRKGKGETRYWDFSLNLSFRILVQVQPFATHSRLPRVSFTFEFRRRCMANR